MHPDILLLGLFVMILIDIYEIFNTYKPKSE